MRAGPKSNTHGLIEGLEERDIGKEAMRRQRQRWEQCLHKARDAKDGKQATKIRRGLVSSLGSLVGALPTALFCTSRLHDCEKNTFLLFQDRLW